MENQTIWQVQRCEGAESGSTDEAGCGRVPEAAGTEEHFGDDPPRNGRRYRRRMRTAASQGAAERRG